MANRENPPALPPSTNPQHVNLEEYNEFMAALINDPYRGLPAPQLPGFTSLMSQYSNIGVMPMQPGVATGNEIPPPTSICRPSSFGSAADTATPSSNTPGESTDGAATSAQTSTSRRARRKTSVVWNHFIAKPETDQAYCLTCKRDVRHVSRTGTGTLTRHLDRHRSQGDTLITVQPGDSSIPESGGEGDENPWQFDYQAARDKLVEVMATTNISFNAAGHPDFGDWASHYMQPQYKPVGRQTYRNDMVNLFQRKQIQLIETFSQLPCR